MKLLRTYRDFQIHLRGTYATHHAKRDLMGVAKSINHSQPAQSVQANHSRNFSLLADFLCIKHRCSFCDELCQLYDVIYKTRCPTLFHTEHHQSSFIGNFHTFCHRNENDDGFVVFCVDLSFHWYMRR